MERNLELLLKEALKCYEKKCYKSDEEVLEAAEGFLR